MTGTGAGLRFRAFALLLTAITALACARTAPTGVDPETVHLNIKQLTLSDGDSTQLTATVRKGGRTVDGVSLDWTSTNRDVIRVNGSGKVKAIGPGTGKVVAKSGNGSDTATVVVTPPPASLEIGPETYNFTANGQTKQFTAQALDDSGNILPDVALEWSSSNSSVATVDSMGRVTSKAAGKATIVVATVCCALSASAAITVADEQQSVSPGNAWFSDGFESGDRSHSENGFSWAVGDGMVAKDYAHSGQYSMRFAYPARDPAKDADVEQRFSIAADASSAPTAIWMEYWVRVPENIQAYLARASAEHDLGKTYNNKLFSLWSEMYDNSLGDAETTVEWTAAGGFSRIEVRPSVLAGADSHAGLRPEQPTYYVDRAPIFRAEDAGKWVRVRIYTKARCRDEVNLRIWMDDRVVAEVRGFDSTKADGLDYFRRGYLFGWANSGFDEPTTFYVDDFRVYTSNPGW